jgi:hypothetical protein
MRRASRSFERRSIERALQAVLSPQASELDTATLQRTFTIRTNEAFVALVPRSCLDIDPTSGEPLVQGVVGFELPFPTPQIRCQRCGIPVSMPIRPIAGLNCRHADFQ